MRCPKCYSDNAYTTGYRVTRKGRSYNIIKCWDCGHLFEEDRTLKWQRNFGKKGNACEIAQTKDGVIIDYYRSIRHAAHVTGYTTYMIEKCLNGVVDEIDGYGWKRI